MSTPLLPRSGTQWFTPPRTDQWPLTGWMTSAVCLGGHWKRLNTVVPGLFKKRSWLSAKLDDPAFEQNRYRLADGGRIEGALLRQQQILQYRQSLVRDVPRDLIFHGAGGRSGPYAVFERISLGEPDITNQV